MGVDEKCCMGQGTFPLSRGGFPLPQGRRRRVGGVTPPATSSWRTSRHPGPGLSVGWGSQRVLPPHSGTHAPAPRHINVPLMKLFWLIYQINTNGTGC